MGQEQEVEVVMNRADSYINWGFRMHNFGKNGVAIQLVYDGSIADAAGLDIADRVVKIGDTDVTGMTLPEAKHLVTQQGDHLRLTVRKRGGLIAVQRPPKKTDAKQPTGRASWYDPAAKETNLPQDIPKPRLPSQSYLGNSEEPKRTETHPTGRGSWYDPAAKETNHPQDMAKPRLPSQSYLGNSEEPKRTETHSTGRGSWYYPAAKETSHSQDMAKRRLPSQSSLPNPDSQPVQLRAPPKQTSFPAYEGTTTEETIAWSRPSMQERLLQQLEHNHSNKTSSSEESIAAGTSPEQNDVIAKTGSLPRGVNSALAPRGEGRAAKRLSGGVSLDDHDQRPRSPMTASTYSFDSLPRGARLSRSAAAEEDDDSGCIIPAYQRNIAMRGLSGSLSKGRESGTSSPSSDHRGSMESLPKNSSLHVRLSRGSATEDATHSLPRNVNSALTPHGEGRSVKRLSGGSFGDSSAPCDVTMRSSNSGLSSEARTSARLSSSSQNEELASLPPYQRELAARLDALTASAGPPPPKMVTAAEEDWSDKAGDHCSLPTYQRDWRKLGSPSRSPRPISPNFLPPAQITLGHSPEEALACDLCAHVISGPFVRILNKFRVHSECVRCHTCGKSLRNDTRVMLEGHLYCESHALEVAQPPEPGLVPMIVFPDEGTN